MGSVRMTDREAFALTLGRDSASWQYASDVRGFLVAGCTLLLQVAHPTIGSGVRDHSNFRQEPWQRLFRTLDYVMLTVYSGDDAVEVTRKLREMHKRIKGVNPDGSRYHALEPGAYAWVQATLVYALVMVHERFGRGIRPDDLERLYQEWLGLGRLLGIREGDLPPDWAGLLAYVDEVVETRLEHTETVDVVLRSIAAPARPPKLPAWTEPLWRVVRAPAAHVLTLCTVGLLPPVLRARFGLRWTAGQDRQLRALAAVSRALTPILPRTLRINGPLYLRTRAKAIPRDEFAPAQYAVRK
ncbi:oxygenase MpaB family protein [Amycolatopsis anabasis]|uniref:oxygenase MpaB family protein n=1 Tax=Amycolatopsis anabasis TaxID=1840409 RepID=UPI00131B6B23|nr:oxygenase MpaB family protein [Amycolatopsis anabasis]